MGWTSVHVQCEAKVNTCLCDEFLWFLCSVIAKVGILLSHVPHYKVMQLLARADAENYIFSFRRSSGPVFVISPKHNQPRRASGAAARYLVQNFVLHLRNNRRLWHCGSVDEEPLLQPALAPAWFVSEIEEQTENKQNEKTSERTSESL